MKKAYTYSSSIADDIRSFIAFRRALGYAVSPSQECILSNLDRYCLENHPGEAVISKDMFTGWMKRREGGKEKLQLQRQAPCHKRACKMPEDAWKGCIC